MLCQMTAFCKHRTRDLLSLESLELLNMNQESDCPHSTSHETITILSASRQPRSSKFQDLDSVDQLTISFFQFDTNGKTESKTVKFSSFSKSTSEPEYPVTMYVFQQYLDQAPTAAAIECRSHRLHGLEVPDASL